MSVFLFYHAGQARERMGYSFRGPADTFDIIVNTAHLTDGVYRSGAGASR